ncbi:MAG: DUF2680 domain-containing protein [Bacillota bacterium]|jgi:hypothetical protein
MKNMRKFIAVAAIIGVLGTAGAIYAAETRSPAEIAASLTGKSITDVNNERGEGKTYGAIAKEAGKLDEFKNQILEQKKAILDQRARDGSITQEKADEIYNAIKDKQTSCDGTGNARMGKKYGAGFGKDEAGFGQGRAKGTGKGMGRGMGNGSCAPNKTNN